MSEDVEDPILRRRKEALQVFEEHPDKFTLEVKDAILANRIILGMTPYDCYLAGGAFAYKVHADRAIWKPNTDPFNVMWAQSVSPDQSEIWMTFETDTQFPNDGVQRFQVYFKNGRAVEITRLANAENKA